MTATAWRWRARLRVTEGVSGGREKLGGAQRQSIELVIGRSKPRRQAGARAWMTVAPKTPGQAPARAVGLLPARRRGGTTHFPWRSGRRPGVSVCHVVKSKCLNETVASKIRINCHQLEQWPWQSVERSRRLRSALCFQSRHLHKNQYVSSSVACLQASLHLCKSLFQKENLVF